MVLWVARTVKAVGFGEFALVTVGRSQQQEHVLAGRNSAALQLYLLHGSSKNHLDRRIIAQDLFDQRRHERTVSPHLGQLLRMGEQAEHRIADQIRRRLVAGQQQQDGQRQNLL